MPSVQVLNLGSPIARPAAPLDINSFPRNDRAWVSLLNDAFIGNALACISAYMSLGGALPATPEVRCDVSDTNACTASF